MTIEQFKQSIIENKMPANISVYLQAMWLDAAGNWDDAHHLIDSLENKTAYNVHAYLHRKEGDSANAGYWYGKAGIQRPDISLANEWEQIVRSLLQ